MNVIVLYLLLLKATVTSFAGLASLPVVRDDLVVQRHLLTDKQLTEAVVITRSTPGPVGLYVVAAGYFAAGIPGAIAGWLAITTPALLIIPLVHYFGSKSRHPRIKSALQAVVVSSSALLLAAAIPLARDALVDPLTLCIAIGTLMIMLKSHFDTLWIILGAAALSVVASTLQLSSIITLHAAAGPRGGM